jgi:ferredoxin
MKDSTKRMSKNLGGDNAEQAVHFYLYSRYLTHYLYKLGAPMNLVEKPPEEEIPPEIDEMIGILTHKVAREALSAETSTYHGKVVPLELAARLVTIDEDVEIRDLDRVIPFGMAHEIVLRHPRSIAVLDCGCRLLQNEPCEPVGVCLAVGEPFVSFMVEHQVLGARTISCEEAVDILRSERERGHVHTAFFKDVTGGRFYAICNCCPCCCIGMKSLLCYGIPLLASSGYVARVNEDLCTGCGDCASICPFGAITVDEVAVVDEDKCMGCGVCPPACDFEAIELMLDPSRGEPLDIDRLLREGGD